MIEDIRPTKLKQVLIHKHITQDLLSHETGINRSDLSRIIGGRFVPNDDHRDKIAKVLGIPTEELFADCPKRSWTECVK